MGDENDQSSSDQEAPVAPRVKTLDPMTGRQISPLNEPNRTGGSIHDYSRFRDHTRFRNRLLRRCGQRQIHIHDRGDHVGVLNLAITPSPTPFVSSRIVLEMMCCEGVPISATFD